MTCAQAISALYRTLLAHYGPQHWWPSRSGMRWEIAAGAVLTQNCAWGNVEKAIDNLGGKAFLPPEHVLAMPDDSLREAIRPAGFFRQKCAYIKNMARFFIAHEHECLHSEDTIDWRNRLLAINGVGPETADSILLYAFNKPIFVIDAYTRRVAKRHLGLDIAQYDALQQVFMDALPRDVYVFQEYHALIVALCKESCRKSGCGALCAKL